MFRYRLPMILALAAFAACSTPPADDKASDVSPGARSNPFLEVSTLPFQAPLFDKITNGDYEPAIEEGMRQQKMEIQAIANNEDEPTFENTFVAMEKSGAMLARVQQAFNAVTGANTNDTLQKIQEAVAPKLAAHRDAIYLNDTLFKRVETVYTKRASLKLDAESERLIEVVYKDFVHAGARLSPADKTRLKALNEEESTLSTQFTNKLLAATTAAALVVKDSTALAGLTGAEIAAAREAATRRGVAAGSYVVPLQNTTQQPALQVLTNRDTRKTLFESSWNRAERSDTNDTRQLIARIAQIRAQQAALIGFPNYAAWKLDNQMAKTPKAALDFMEQLAPAATARARAEAKDIEAVIAAQHGGFALEPWDWTLYAEQVRKAKYDLDESQLRPYFELDNVLQNGVFYAANRLYGISFKERKDLPVYHPDVRVFEVTDSTGASIALFYADYFKRDNKNGGAWMDNLVGQSRLLGTKPVVYNVANLPKPVAGQPALLSMDDVITMFHEFGHALHGMFANEMYPTLSGTNTARDFVEFPSQFNEHWATEPSVFANYAKHYQTGESMPQALVEKTKRARSFNQGYAMTELLAAALLDMNWHTLAVSAPLQDADRFETNALRQDKVDLRYVPPRYRSSYFQHIWGNGYAAGYYAYLWTQMLADDGFEWFTEHGGLTRANGDRFRTMVLSRGNTIDLATMYRDWRGADPRIGPMLENRGLKSSEKN